MRIFVVSGPQPSAQPSAHLSLEAARAAAASLPRCVITELHLNVGLELTYGGRSNTVPLSAETILAELVSANMHGHQNTGCAPDSVRIVETP
jgi:hypothetical protein